MKNLFKKTSYLLLIILALILVGCSQKESLKDINFEAQYIKTDGNTEELVEPIIKKIQSTQELNNYYSNNKKNYDFMSNSEQSISFTTAIDKYNEEFFQNSFLVLILIKEESSDIYHNVISISKEGKISIDRKSLNNDNHDSTKWHILVEIDKKYSNIDYSVSLEEVETD